MQSKRRLQRDLFEEKCSPPTLPAARRSALVRLTEGLLVEALTGKASEPSVAAPDKREAAHEQDHA